MKSFTIVTSASMLVLASAAALPTPIEERADTNVYLCNDRNFSGYCMLISTPFKTCVLLGNDLNNLVSAVGSDQGTTCYFYVNPNCDTTGGFFHVGWPGVSDLSVTPVNGPAGSTRNYEDQLSSYQCFSDSL